MDLHVITNFSEPNGAEKMLARLLNHASTGDALVVPLMGVSERTQKLIESNSTRFQPLGAHSAASLAGATLKLRKIIKSEQPATIVCWMYHAMAAGSIAARLSGIKVPVYWNVRQSLDDWGSMSLSTRMSVRLCKVLSGMPSGTIYNSRRALELHGEKGFHNHNATVIPNGLSIPQKPNEPPRKARVFGVAGRFHPQKGHDTFFAAAGKVLKSSPDCRFILVGSGLTSENDKVTQLLHDNNIPADRIELRGPIDDMESFYRSIDVLVLSSRTEGFPNVVVESMSFGRPAVTTDVGDAAAIVAHTGFIATPGEPEELASGMMKFLQMSPEEYKALSDKAYDRVSENYSIDAISKIYRKFFDQ
ncbi:MAG: glycosyltransferase [Stappiaceae bacterium]